MRKTLKEEVEEYKDKYLRTLAELENYKKRAKKEKEDLLAFATESFLFELLKVADDFDRCLESLKAIKQPAEGVKDLDEFYRGVELISNNLMQFLKQQGVCYFCACGETFDPNFHEAISTEETKDKKANIVVKEISKGYMLNDKVLRPAKVIVSKE